MTVLKMAQTRPFRVERVHVAPIRGINRDVELADIRRSARSYGLCTFHRLFGIARGITQRLPHCTRTEVRNASKATDLPKSDRTEHCIDDGSDRAEMQNWAT